MKAIIGIQIENRREEAAKLQDILTNYGCMIKTRIGLHDMGDYSCLDYGIVLIDVDKINQIYDELSKLWNVQVMRF